MRGILGETAEEKLRARAESAFALERIQVSLGASF